MNVTPYYQLIVVSLQSISKIIQFPSSRILQTGMHPTPPALGGGAGGKNFRKVFAGRGVGNLYFGGGGQVILSEGGSSLLFLVIHYPAA